MLRPRLLISVMTLLIVGHTRAEDIVFDDFSDGDLSVWTTYGSGSATVDGGDLRINNANLPAKLALFSDTISGNASIRTQARLIDGGLGLVLNFDAHNVDAYYLSVSDDYDFIFGPIVDGIGIADYDPVDVGPATDLDEDWVIQMDLEDDTITAWLWRESTGPPESPQLSFPLEGHRLLDEGFAGVWAWHGESIVRYVHIADSPIPIDRPLRLMPGDANQDYSFDQLDLVQVLQAAKYLTGKAATWGEGDWDGAPGGEPNSPPVGNGLFDQFDIISALGTGAYLNGPYAATAMVGAIPASVPEPSSIILAAVGLVAWLNMGRRMARPAANQYTVWAN